MEGDEEELMKDVVNTVAVVKTEELAGVEDFFFICIYFLMLQY